MAYHESKEGPVTQVRLRHSIELPAYRKVEYHRQHPAEGPSMVLLSGGSGARALSETLIQYTHRSVHVLPTFDDGGSSRELRQKLGMPPPGDLRNRLMALSDMSMRGNPAVSRLFRTRLPAEGTVEALRQELDSFLDERHPQMKRIEPRYRRIILKHLERFVGQMPGDFDLRGGNLGNFVIAGAYLAVGDLESVIFEFSALAAVRGEVYPVCCGGDYHLLGELDDGSTWVGQARLTGQPHPPIRRLAIVEQCEERWVEVHPALNPHVERALRSTSLVAYTMGSFYTSLVSNLIVGDLGRVIRETRRPKVFVANLLRDEETPGMTVSGMLTELHRYLCASDPSPGALADYVHYVLVGTHGPSDGGGYVPVDLEAIAALGVEPIVLPVEAQPMGQGMHEPGVVASVLLSLC